MTRPTGSTASRAEADSIAAKLGELRVLLRDRWYWELSTSATFGSYTKSRNEHLAAAQSAREHLDACERAILFLRTLELPEAIDAVDPDDAK